VIQPEYSPQSSFIGLGSNVGDRLQNLATAVAALNSASVQVVRVSPVYETQYVGPHPASQPDYLNCVAQIRTILDPRALLLRLHELEAAAGRSTCDRAGPRPLDADLLLYGNTTIESDGLVVPHPRMWDRAFVLVPLSDLDPAVPTPEGRPVVQRARELQEQGQRVRLYAQWRFTIRPSDGLLPWSAD